MSAASAPPLFDEIIDFLAAAPTTEEIIAFEPPPHLQQRLSELLEKNRKALISAEERAELDEFLRMDRFMSRLKQRARRSSVES